MIGPARRLRMEAGFSLLTVMIAMLLLSIGIMALSTSGVYMRGLQTEGSVRSSALAVAAGYLEEVKTRQPGHIVTEEPVPVDGTGEPASTGPFRRSLVVTEDTVLNTKRLAVGVDYPGGMGNRRSVELVTILYVGEE